MPQKQKDFLTQDKHCLVQCSKIIEESISKHVFSEGKKMANPETGQKS